MKRIAMTVLVLTALGTATALAPADAAPRSHGTLQPRAGSYRVTATVSKTEPQQDTTIKIKARVSPAAPGATVRLQVKYAGRKSWKTIGHGRLNGAGKVTFKDKVSTVRERRYRVVKPAGAGRGAGQGTTPRVTVFGWRPLTSLAAIGSTGFSPQSTLNINGTAYPDSLSTWTTGPQPFHVDYNLNRDCKRLKATFGADDRSAVSGTTTLGLAADGVARFVGSFGLTQSQHVATNLSGVFRITVNATIANGGIGAVGSPQVLCSF